MDEENIKDIPDADHQHLQSIEREQEFVEEENYMADSASFKDIRTREQEIIQNVEKIWMYNPTHMQKIIEEREEIRIYNPTHMQEIIEEREEIWIYNPICLLDIQKKEKILCCDWICGQDFFSNIIEIRIYNPICAQEIFPNRIDKTAKTTKTRHSTMALLCAPSVFKIPSVIFYGFLLIPIRTDDCVKIRGGTVCVIPPGSREEIIVSVANNALFFSENGIRAKKDQILQERSFYNQQMSENQPDRKQRGCKPVTTFGHLATRIVHVSVAKLLGFGSLALNFFSVAAEFHEDVVPILSHSNDCNINRKMLSEICSHDTTKAFHCLQDDDDQLVIGCFRKTWVTGGQCPFFRKVLGLLDIRPCSGNSNDCPSVAFISDEVYKYPGCLVDSSSIHHLLKIQNMTGTTNSMMMTEETSVSLSAEDTDTTHLVCCVVLVIIIVGLSFIFLYFSRLRNRKQGCNAMCNGNKTRSAQRPEEERIDTANV